MQICKNNHFLGRVFSLKGYEGNPLYSKNRFSCAGCKAVKEVSAEGVHHCGTCDFTVCAECARIEDRLWT